MDEYSSERSAAKVIRRRAGKAKSDAAIRALFEEIKKPRVRISVERYDTSLPEEDIKKALINHFTSCGKIHIVTFSESRVGRAFIILRGYGAEEKALQLNGSDVGGWNVHVQVTPEEDEETQRYAASLHAETFYDERFRFGITVRGYDTSLPADDLKSTLIKHFSSCGEITHVLINTLRSNAHVYFVQKDGEDKALELDGTEVGGWKIVATPVAKARFSYPLHGRLPRYVGRPPHCMMMANEIHEKIMAFKRMRGLV